MPSLVHDAPQNPKDLRNPMDLVQDDELPVMHRKVVVRISQLGKILMVLQVKIGRTSVFGDFAG